MPSFQFFKPLKALRIGSAFLFCGAIAVILLPLGYREAAGGMMIGFALYTANALLLVESGRALLGGSRRGGRVAVAVSSVGRFLLLGVLLAAVFLFLSRPTGIGACGGLLVSQVNLHLTSRRTGVAI
ncbi:MAG: hypothetical protein WBC63_06860 [Candidatus Bipolaricaulia bacterium]